MTCSRGQALAAIRRAAAARLTASEFFSGAAKLRSSDAETRGDIGKGDTFVDEVAERLEFIGGVACFRARTFSRRLDFNGGRYRLVMTLHGTA